MKSSTQESLTPIEALYLKARAKLAELFPDFAEVINAGAERELERDLTNYALALRHIPNVDWLPAERQREMLAGLEETLFDVLTARDSEYYVDKLMRRPNRFSHGDFMQDSQTIKAFFISHRGHENRGMGATIVTAKSEERARAILDIWFRSKPDALGQLDSTWKFPLLPLKNSPLKDYPVNTDTEGLTAEFWYSNPAGLEEKDYVIVS